MVQNDVRFVQPMPPVSCTISILDRDDGKGWAQSDNV